MGKFSKAGGREMPELNTSSLPEIGRASCRERV